MATPQDPLLAQINDVHASHRARRTLYREPDKLADDSVTSTVLKEHLVRAGVLFAIVFLITFFMWMVTFLLAITSLLTELTRRADSAAPPIGLVFFLSLVLWIGWFVTLFRPIREPIAEYCLLIEDRAAAAPSSYWWIMDVIRRRHSQFMASPCRIGGELMVHLSNRRDESLIVVKPYGTDLYVGWTMWRVRSTIVVIGHMIRDLFRNVQGGATFWSAVRGSDTRALRETTHSVTRESVQVAILNLRMTDAMTAELNQVPVMPLHESGMPAPPRPPMPAPPAPAPPAAPPTGPTSATLPADAPPAAPTTDAPPSGPTADADHGSR